MSSNKLILYYAPGSCGLAPHIVLNASGLEYELSKITFGDGTRTTEKGEDYYKINPAGAVPSLRMENGEVLTEGPAIMQYVADKAPASKMAPPNGTLERYRLQELLNFITSELHKSFGPLFYGKTQEEKDQAAKKVQTKLALLEKKLDKSTFLMGDQLTAADAYLLVMLRWCAKFHVEVSPKLQNYKRHVEEQQAVHSALEQEGLI